VTSGGVDGFENHSVPRLYINNNKYCWFELLLLLLLLLLHVVAYRYTEYTINYIHNIRMCIASIVLYIKRCI